MIRPIFCNLNINNFINNFFIIKKLSFKKKIWVVFKANAYGHGIKNLYKFIWKYVDGFAVVDLKEALILRKLGFKKSILLLEGYFDIDDIYLCIKFNLTVVLHSYWQINLLNNINFKFYKLNVYLKFNNDLNRLGFNIKDFKKMYFILKKKIYIKNISLMIHLAKSNKNDNKYNYLYNYNKLNFLKFKDISIFSSSGLLWHINNVFNNWLRIGILLYGCSPNGNYNDIKSYGFKPVMSLNSKIISIRRIKKGQNIGYSNLYNSDIDRLIGIVACGYADGYPRQLSNKSYVLINNYFKAKILGYISMDMMIVDLLNNNNINIGSNVELWGENLFIDDVSKLANTISYNLMCCINHNRIIFKYI